jgi:hypothetical protein
VRPPKFGRSLTTEHHDLTGHRPGRGDRHAIGLLKSTPSHLPQCDMGGLMAHRALMAHTFPAEIRVRRHLGHLVRRFFQKEFGPCGPGAPCTPASGRPSAGGFHGPPDHNLVSRVRAGNEQNLFTLIKQRT